SRALIQIGTTPLGCDSFIDQILPSAAERYGVWGVVTGKARDTVAEETVGAMTCRTIGARVRWAIQAGDVWHRSLAWAAVTTRQPGNGGSRMGIVKDRASGSALEERERGYGSGVTSGGGSRRGEGLSVRRRCY